MALLWLDSFDDRTASYGNKYDASSGTIATQNSGRTGAGITLAGTTNPSFVKTIGTKGVVQVGFGIRIASPPSTGVPFLEFLDGSLVQAYLQATSGSLLELRRGGDQVLLARSVNVISATVWGHVELRFAPHLSAGSGQIRIQGTQDFNVGGLNSRHSGSVNNSLTSVRFLCPVAAATLELDDLYVADSSGSLNAGLLGQIKVECLRPTGVGQVSGWLPLSSPNWSQVNDTSPDGDATFVAAPTSGLIDTYQFANLSTTGAVVAGVQSLFWARKDDLSARAVAPVVRQGNTNYVGTASALGLSYGLTTTMYETDPATSASWAVSGINTVEFGIDCTL